MRPRRGVSTRPLGLATQLRAPRHARVSSGSAAVRRRSGRRDTLDGASPNIASQGSGGDAGGSGGGASATGGCASGAQGGAGGTDAQATMQDSAQQVRDVSDHAQASTGDSVEEVASGLERGSQQPDYGIEGN